MAMEDFNPERLKHVKGQEGRVDDQEKAERMAQKEDYERDIAKEYKEYLAHPDSFDTIGPYGMFIVSQFEGLAQRGATPEFLEKAAEITTEKAEALFEFERSLAGKNDKELRNELRYLRYQDIFANALSNLTGRDIGDTIERTADEANYATKRELVWGKIKRIEDELSDRSRKQEGK